MKRLKVFRIMAYSIVLFSLLGIAVVYGTIGSATYTVYTASKCVSGGGGTVPLDDEGRYEICTGDTYCIGLAGIELSGPLTVNITCGEQSDIIAFTSHSGSVEAGSFLWTAPSLLDSTTCTVQYRNSESSEYLDATGSPIQVCDEYCEDGDDDEYNLLQLHTVPEIPIGIVGTVLTLLAALGIFVLAKHRFYN